MICSNMGGIAEEIATWEKQLPVGTQLVAVSKEQPPEKIVAAYEAGHRHFGENKAQALLARYETLPKDIHWHMIGHLQRNKVRFIAPFVHLIQSVDSIRLLQRIEQEGKRQNRLVSCLLQLHIAADEPHKYGLQSTELANILDKDTLDQLPHVQIRGLMGMASHNRDRSKVLQEFKVLQQHFLALQKEIRHPRVQMQTLSMGMSGDYREALAAGSNMLRIGSALFGARPPNLP